MARAEDLYGEMGSVPTAGQDVTPVNGSGARPLNLHANPEDFGAPIGAGLQKIGQEGQQIAQQFQEMAVHTATNDLYVNQYAPAVNDLVSNYKKSRRQL